MKVCSRHRDSDYPRAGRYKNHWKCTINIQKAWDNIPVDVECYQKQSERSCKFLQHGVRGRQERCWWSFSAWQAEQSWWTWRGDGHTHQTIQNCMVSFWQKRIMLDKLTQTEGGNVGVQFGEWYEVQNGRIDGSSSCDAPNRHYCSHTITYNICRANDDIVSSADNQKCHKWLLTQEVVQWQWVKRNPNHTIAYRPVAWLWISFVTD